MPIEQTNIETIDSAFEAPVNIETPIGNFIGRKTGDGYELASDNVAAPENSSINFEIKLKKKPAALETGMLVNGVTIDSENYDQKMQEMVQEARELTSLSERDRILKLMEMILSRVSYAYKDKIDKVSEEEKDWVEQNILTGFTKVDLSAVVQHGFAVCRHFPVLFLVLAQEAGLSGTVATKPTGRDMLLNLQRKETDYQANDGRKTIFRSYEQDAQTPIGHSWAEIMVAENGQEEWIPVDLATQLIGDNPERLQTFIDAGYVSYLKNSIEGELSSSKDIPNSLKLDFPRAVILPGQSQIGLDFTLDNEPYEMLIIGKNLSGAEQNQPAEPFNGDLKIAFHNSAQINDSHNLEVLSVQPKKAE